MIFFPVDVSSSKLHKTVLSSALPSEAEFFLDFLGLAGVLTRLNASGMVGVDSVPKSLGSLGFSDKRIAVFYSVS